MLSDPFWSKFPTTTSSKLPPVVRLVASCGEFPAPSTVKSSSALPRSKGYDWSNPRRKSSDALHLLTWRCFWGYVFWYLLCVFVKGLLIPVIGFVFACGNLSCFLLICFDICFGIWFDQSSTNLTKLHRLWFVVIGSSKIQLYIRHAVPLDPSIGSKFPKDPHQPLWVHRVFLQTTPTHTHRNEQFPTMKNRDQSQVSPSWSFFFKLLGNPPSIFFIFF